MWGIDVPIKSIINQIELHQFETEDEVKDAFEHCIKKLQQARFDSVKKFRKLSKCTHTEYAPATYSLRRNWCNEFHYHFERKCLGCGFIDFVITKNREKQPKWGENATEQYYNNNI